jgi:hypothetical protein
MTQGVWKKWWRYSLVTHRISECSETKGTNESLLLITGKHTVVPGLLDAWWQSTSSLQFLRCQSSLCYYAVPKKREKILHSLNVI